MFIFVKELLYKFFFFTSDLIIQLEGQQDVKAHKFILSARSDHWGVPDLSLISVLDFTGKVIVTCTCCRLLDQVFLLFLTFTIFLGNLHFRASTEICRREMQCLFSSWEVVIKHSVFYIFVVSKMVRLHQSIK